MIQVKFSKGNGDNSIRLRLVGHAGYEKEGKDIVCSAASILAYTVAQIILSMDEKGKLQRKPMIRLDSGDILLVCTPKKRHYAAAVHSFAVVQVGYALIEESYPENLKLTTFDPGIKP